jgi:hypothetical protein
MDSQVEKDSNLYVNAIADPIATEKLTNKLLALTTKSNYNF